MCGIVGYIGKQQAAPILLEGLKKLEYRGYDSAGVAVRDGAKSIQVVKAKGKLSVLAQKTEDGKALYGTCGIGHTRWATHGEPDERNAHPHRSTDGSVAVVHNGILENYRELREELKDCGYTFASQTDTEVIANLIDFYLKRDRKGAAEAISRFMERARGSYAIAVMFEEFAGELYLARKDSPMIVGEGEGEMFVASDAAAILRHTRKVYFVDDFTLACVRADGVRFFDISGNPIPKEYQLLDIDAEAAGKGGYEHFMRKEIYEQPRAVSDTLSHYIKEGDIDLGISLHGVKQITVVACGSAYHVGVTLQYAIEKLARIPVRVELASEFRYRDPILGEGTLVVAVSQSGETADTLAAVREAKKRGARTLGIVNVLGSSVAREADDVLYTYAGPEIAVATTKAYSAQLALGYLVALVLGKNNKTLSEEQFARYVSALQELPSKIEETLRSESEIKAFAARHADVHDVFMIGRGIDYAVCMEGALKLKEVSYVHTEAYAAGELKHGTISLVEEGTLVLGVLTQSGVFEKTASNLEETSSRGAIVATVGTKKLCEGQFFPIPETEEPFAASLAVLPLQLLAYHISVCRGLDVDKPRNLAKSVTVE